MRSTNHKDKRAVMTRIVCLLLCVLMVGGLVTSALLIMVSGAGSAEIRKELDALKSQANEIAAQGAALEKELSENKSETQTTIEKKVAIDQRISVTEAEIQNINQQIKQYNLLIAEKQTELEASQEDLAQMNARYKARIRAMEESGKVSYWSILFKANSFSDLLSRIDSIQEIAQADQLMLAQMKELSVQIEADRQELETELAAQEDAKVALADMEQTLQLQREEADALLIQLAEAYNELSEEYLANAAREEELQKEMIQVQLAYEAALSAEQKAALAQQNKNNVAGGGTVSGGGSGFSSPLNYLTVTCAFGPRIHPLWGTKSNHTGVDLAANQGDPIYAIASGTVTAAGYSDAYGYNVTISHGNGYGSMYAHMTNYTVSVGQSVSQGQVIGYVGSTGWSTGPHLHFEIYVNGAPVNPMRYIG
ncbi:MAG: peptidoglycan DD-metalloendopeptidase family protein [Oscillospiraceae bacterium]|nr:peptidoglycan DD-metalloendopeptidase family protein [Oscillospiraceae bacterium]